LSLDDRFGFNFGFWYDFGGTWDEQGKRWRLWGDSIADIDYSCNPVVRVGGTADIVPMGRRSLFSQSELDRVRTIPGQPNASGVLTGVLNGGGVSVPAAGLSPFAVDAFDSYIYSAFIAGKYRGFSLYNEWWVRDVNNFRGFRALGAPTVNNAILYSVNNV